MTTEADAGAAGADVKVDAGAADAGKTIVDANAGAGDGSDAAALAAAEAAKGDAGKGEAAKTEGTVDWRARLAGEDKELAKTLSRYSDEASFGKAHRALLTKMSSGELKKALPEGASAEEVATWRKENGIPDKPEAYVEAFKSPKGIVLSEADKPIVAQIAAAAIEKNLTPDQYNGIVEKYYEVQEAQAAQQAETDATFKQQSEDALRADWQGGDYRGNLQAIQNMIAGWPEGLADKVLAGRDADGRKLGDNPAFVKQLASLARELNPAATLVPAGTTDAAKGVADRIAEIRKFRTENPEKYDANKPMQAEELQLIEADLRMKKRSA